MSVELDAEVSPVPGRRLTAEEYFQMPEGPPYFQLIDGELFMSPSASYFHQRIVGNLYRVLQDWIEPRELGDVAMAPSDVQLDDENVFQPDLYYVRAGRFDIIGEQGPGGAPDLVVEVISPSTARIDLGRKRQTYFKRGVKEFWALFPKTSEVEVHSANDLENPVRFDAHSTLTTDLLPGLQIPVSVLFRSPAQKRK